MPLNRWTINPLTKTMKKDLIHSKTSPNRYDRKAFNDPQSWSNQSETGFDAEPFEIPILTGRTRATQAKSVDDDDAQYVLGYN